MSPRTIICVLLLAFQFVFLLRLVMSFFPIGMGSPMAGVRDLSVAITDPVVVPIRRSLPPMQGALAMIGLAELLVLIILQVLIRIICGA